MGSKYLAAKHLEVTSSQSRERLVLVQVLAHLLPQTLERPTTTDTV